MIRYRGFILTLILLSLTSYGADAQDRLIGFQTPSKNIACQFYTDNGQGVLRCDIMNMETRPRRPADCELEWGNAFEMSAKGSAGRICAGDTIMDPCHCPCWPMARCGSARDSHAGPSRRG
jgi:hypothetical protein